ncbi:MAG: diguanylate cyclase [Trichodesmium sp.]
MRETILIINHKPTKLGLLKQLLFVQGYKVKIATSSREALETIQIDLPDLILLEVTMPEMDGYQICEYLKMDEKTLNIPVIFISALSGVMDKIKAFTVGAVDYVTQPFELVEILARIENQLRLRSLQRQLEQQNTELQLLLKATHAISEASDFESALEVILLEICQTMNWNFGEAWIPKKEGKILELCGFWYDSNTINGIFPPSFNFRKKDKNLDFISQPNLLKRVWHSRQAEWIEDNFQDKDYIFICSQIDQKIGIKSALGIPIIQNQQVLAILAFFHQNARIVDQNSMQLVNAVATQLGGLIQRKKAELALIKANQDLELIASLDSLTLLANRRKFDEYFHQQWELLRQEQKSLSLILCDVDYFKNYNDCYGHPEGDQCLQKVAQTISNVRKFSDGLICRYGGEEFAIILPNTDLEVALEIGELIREKINNLYIPHVCSKVSSYVTVSLGVSSVIPSLELSARILLIEADKALYQAKEKGRNCVVANKCSYIF